jgi:hypothetical protein
VDDATREAASGGTIKIIVPAGDARIDHRDADAPAGDANRAACQRCTDRETRALHRGEGGSIDHYPLNARIGGQRAEHQVVDFANLRAPIKTPPDNAAPEDAYVGIAFELHDDPRAADHLASAVTENGIQLVALSPRGLR